MKPDLLTRIVLTEDLRRYAVRLAAGPALAALRSNEAQSIRAALEILAAWERAIPLDDLVDFLEHRDREVRLLAFRMAGYTGVNLPSRRALVRSLHDPDALIRGLAIVAVGRQKMTEAIPELALCLRREALEEARMAAAALADMPPLGWRAAGGTQLQRQSPDRAGRPGSPGTRTERRLMLTILLALLARGAHGAGRRQSRCAD